MRRNTIMIIGILAMLLLAGSLMADDIYVHVTNTCEVDIDIYNGTTWVHGWPDFTAYPNQNNSHTFEPIPGYTYTVIADGIRNVGSFYYTDSDSGYLSLTHPDILHLYLDVSGKEENGQMQD